MNDDWIKGLKEGDELIDGDTVCTVVKVGKLHVSYRRGGHTERAQLRSGRVVGTSGWHARYIGQATPEAKQKIANRRELLWARYESQLELAKLTPNQIRAVRALIATFKSQEKAKEDARS